ncbi:glucose-6-phosphate isomerase [Intrasporangium oryzae NRRL B-24470]|uniref:Glucose-6-phosphate isomerase n=1 Tax=Intrasporangium oryzae NRRL B-24470 TaxID=1386089 RepID=W9G721_9MICO|nr:glucose-6-phosphate isomerase [Intrasporangium oryzae]EWT01830.1 glucose-6-phosphate isomerase [Intrasporangium oryzae NRRL B-24470]
MSSLSVSAAGAAADAIARHVPNLVTDAVASRLLARDPTLWGPDAGAATADEHVSWVGLPRTSRPLLGEVAALRDSFVTRGLDHVVLCGTGASARAAEAICAAAGVDLLVLDTADPDAVRRALDDRLARTVVVVSSRSGSSVQTDAHLRAYEQAFADAGIVPADRVVVVTLPGSPLDLESRGKGYRVVNADPAVGGRYSALTAFGLVPAGLAGADVAALLDEAESVADLVADDDVANPALRLAAALGGTHLLRDTIVLLDDDSGLGGLSDWVGALLLESLGANGTGPLPVVVEGGDAPELAHLDDDALVARLVASDDETPASHDEVRVGGSLGAQFLLWQAAAAVAGRLLGASPLDRPDAAAATTVGTSRQADPSGATRAAAAGGPAFVDAAIEVNALGGEWLGSAASVDEAVKSLLAELGDVDHVAVLAYLDRHGDAVLAESRAALAARAGRPVAFGWGPRFPHPGDRLHERGPADGVYIQITSAPKEDLPVPGREFTFGDVIAAQAGADAEVLTDRSRPVLRLHLSDHDAGLAQLRAALVAGARA